MKKIDYYVCPVCGISSMNREEIQRHLSQHTLAKTVVCCNICGEGWYVDVHGEELCLKHAAECEKKHIRAGEADEVATHTFFASGGTLGYARTISREE